MIRVNNKLKNFVQIVKIKFIRQKRFEISRSAEQTHSLKSGSESLKVCFFLAMAPPEPLCLPKVLYKSCRQRIDLLQLNLELPGVHELPR